MNKDSCNHGHKCKLKVQNGLTSSDSSKVTRENLNSSQKDAEKVEISDKSDSGEDFQPMEFEDITKDIDPTGKLENLSQIANNELQDDKTVCNNEISGPVVYTPANPDEEVVAYSEDSTSCHHSLPEPSGELILPENDQFQLSEDLVISLDTVTPKGGQSANGVLSKQSEQLKGNYLSNGLDCGCVNVECSQSKVVDSGTKCSVAKQKSGLNNVENCCHDENITKQVQTCEDCLRPIEGNSTKQVQTCKVCLSPSKGNSTKQVQTCEDCMSPSKGNSTKYVQTCEICLTPSKGNSTKHVQTCEVCLTPSEGNSTKHVQTCENCLTPSDGNSTKNLHCSCCSDCKHKTDEQLTTKEASASTCVSGKKNKPHSLTIKLDANKESTGVSSCESEGDTAPNTPVGQKVRNLHPMYCCGC